MKISFFLFILLFSFTIQGQSTDIWTSFWNTDSTLIGYKDKNEGVKIEPKFTPGFTIANKFENIIAVSENGYDKGNSYYLSKTGRIVGKDSIYSFDNSPDCESEGFIRFRDSKTEKVGMFNRNGDIIIPAIYNDLTRVRNGMFIALKGAEKHYLVGDEHYNWKGGKEFLIDTNNNILINDFTFDSKLNFFSLEKSNKPHSDTTRQSFLANDGSYYSFVDFEKEFSQWITTEILNDLTLEKLINISYNTITWETKKGWKKTSKEKLIANNYEILKNGLQEILQANTKFFISSDGLNPYMFQGAEFEQYFNNCGESKDWLYPTMSLVISHQSNKDFTQNHYEFLRTDNGYKLICLTIRNEQMK